MTLGLHESALGVERKPHGLWTGGARYGGRMHWRELFDDLEAQMSHADREAFDDEVRERAAAERASVSMGAVLAAAEGAQLRLTLRDGSRLEGTVRDSAAQWLYLSQGALEWLVPVTAIAAIDGLASGAPAPGPVAQRLSLGHALRALAEDGADVLVTAVGSVHRGRITTVGSDYIALGGVLVPFAAILTVSPAR